MRPPKPEPPEGTEVRGLAWRPRKKHWQGYWIARPGLVEDGYPTKSQLLWSSETAPTPDDWKKLSTACDVLQDQMLTWSNPKAVKFDALKLFNDTLASLIDIYLKDPGSGYQRLRYGASRTYAKDIQTIRNLYGSKRISALTFRDFQEWYESALEHDSPNPISYAHGRMTKVRLLFSHGTLAELPGCAKASIVLSKMEFELPKSRVETLNSNHVALIRPRAHEVGKPSIAFAQALHFSLMVRQKDVIGELIPREYPGLSDIHMGPDKWVVGFRWEGLDQNFMFTHRLSKSLRGKRALATAQAGKVKNWNLWLYPMIIEELCLMARCSRAELRRDMFPATGPMVTADHTPGLPWRYKMFAKEWRKIAKAVGIPKNVQERDTRAGAATDADQKGADVDRKRAAERIRPALGHSQSDTTLIYLRGDDEHTAEIARLRFGDQSKP